MKRREFLKAGIAGTASLAAIQIRAFAAGAEHKPRVALIGSGWYGKTDLFHLIQVAPVDVVALCDVDQNMVAEAADLFAASATRHHMQNFLTARQGQKRPVSDIEEGYVSSACCILANVSMELGRSLQLDTKTGQILGDEHATRSLARKYRGAWQHPTPNGV